MTLHQWRIVNLVLTIAWVAMVPIALVTGWIESLIFISAASIYANAASHLAAWRADVPDDVLLDVQTRVKNIEDKLS